MSERERLLIEIAGGIAAAVVIMALFFVFSFLAYCGALVVWGLVA